MDGLLHLLNLAGQHIRLLEERLKAMHNDRVELEAEVQRLQAELSARDLE